MPLTDKQWKTLARDLRSAIARVAPEWTDTNEHDPGITVLEVLCYAITDLQYRSDALDGRARLLARTVAERASVLAEPAPGDAGDECAAGLQRVNYTTGMLLGVDDFKTEQQYLRDRLRRHNRLLHGSGIAAGLDVAVEQDAAGSRITIAPGFALDPAGNEICVEQPVQLALPPPGPELFVLLHYAEQPCRNVPVVASGTGDDAVGGTLSQPTRIVETFSVALAAAPEADSVALARLKQFRGRWRVDARFKVARWRPKQKLATGEPSGAS
jgi:hypothetical protein